MTEYSHQNLYVDIRDY